MANQADKEKAEELERKHKQLFAYLVQATNFYQNLLGKFPSSNPTVVEYGQKTRKIAKAWLDRQILLEAKGVPKYRPNFFDFSKSNRNSLNAAMNKLINQSNQMGWYTVAIWAGRVLLGFGAAWIVDQLTTTTKEQAQLQNDTLATCTKLKLNADECKKYMFQQTSLTDKQGTGIFSGFKIPLIVWIGGGLILANEFGLLKKFKKTT